MTRDTPEFEFSCPACGETLRVDASMRTTLLERGCVVCGTVVTTGAFSSE
jgi:predicted RNA-binding Zn-ribbon protein involved in translation (DUF1610 family)